MHSLSSLFVAVKIENKFVKQIPPSRAMNTCATDKFKGFCTINSAKNPRSSVAKYVKIMSVGFVYKKNKQGECVQGHTYDKQNQMFLSNWMGKLTRYCIRTLTRYFRINYTDQCITKQVLHLYTMDTCSILCCNTMTV